MIRHRESGAIVHTASRWPLIVACIFLLVITGVLVGKMAVTASGAVVYPLDDTYIHMSMARNLAQHGVWGISPAGFTSSSSSPLWTLLLAAGFALFGVWEGFPLLLNILTALGIMAVVSAQLNRVRMSSGRRLLGMLSIILFVPLPFIVTSGLEHTLHILLALFFLTLFLRMLDGTIRPEAPSTLTLVMVTSLLLTMTRLESVFMISAAALILVWNRHLRSGFACLAGMLTPLVTYAILSLSRGWYLLPNPVLLKGNRFDVITPGGWLRLFHYGIKQLVYNPHLLLLILALLAFLVRSTRRGDRKTSPLDWTGWMVLFTVAGHLGLARSGFFLTYYFQIRYEGYLVALLALGLLLRLGALPAAIPGGNRRLRGWLRWAVLLVLLLPLAERGLRTVLKIPGASRNTLCHQVQLGHFFGEYFPGVPVLVNDIGAMTFYGFIQPVDLLGLSDRETAAMILTDRFSSAAVDRHARASGARIAAVYADFLRRAGGIPESWHPVARWTIENHVVSREDTVTLFALDSEMATSLRRLLTGYRDSLPEGIRLRLEDVSGDVYTGNSIEEEVDDV